MTVLPTQVGSGTVLSGVGVGVKSRAATKQEANMQATSMKQKTWNEEVPFQGATRRCRKQGKIVRITPRTSAFPRAAPAQARSCACCPGLSRACGCQDETRGPDR